MLRFHDRFGRGCGRRPDGSIAEAEVLTEVIMPKMGTTMEEGTVVRWLKGIGDPVKVDEPLVEIATEKINTTLESPAEGILCEILVGENSTAPIAAVLARIRSEGSP